MHRLRERAAQLFRGPSRSFRQLRSAAPRQVEPTESLHVLRCRYASYSLSKRQPGSDTLLRQCLVQMAYQPHLLTASVISRLSTDIAQLLLEELIHAGKLTREVLLCFEGVHLWHAPLQGYPGADASWLALLVRAKLTHVDVSDTQVWGPCATSHSVLAYIGVAQIVCMGCCMLRRMLVSLLICLAHSCKCLLKNIKSCSLASTQHHCGALQSAGG